MSITMTSQQLLEQAVEHHRAGRLAEAHSIYQRILAINPADANALNLLSVLAGQALDKRGQTEEAIAALRQALTVNPRFSAAHDALCSILIRERRFLEVADVCRRLLALDPALAQAHAQLGAALKMVGDQAGALASLSRALELHPNSLQILVNIADVLNQMGRFREAADIAQRAIALEPGRSEAYAFLGYALEHLGQLSAAADAYGSAVRLNPTDNDSRGSLAGALLETMRFDQAIATYRQGLTQDPKAHRLHSDMLLALNYSPTISETALFEEHNLWAKIHAPPFVGDQTIAQSNLPLRVGYISPDLRGHPVSHFIAPLLAGHNPAAVHRIVYCDVDRPDEVTARLHQLVNPDGWRDVSQMTDDQVERQVREDRIDILVDLAGHTGRNRLAVFARKPAPIQITYLGYPNTTGLPRDLMTYRLTDFHCDPSGLTESLHTEELVRLPNCFICYQPPQGAPEVAPVPMASKGYATFGSFSAMPKISQRVIELWARILRQVPQSRLMLKNRTLLDQGNRHTLHDMFRRGGIDQDRLILVATVASHAQHLQRYCEVDVALDPFPYQGTTTTCEALWMGVPVVTLAGKSHRSRVGVSLLNNVGLKDLIADSPAEYEKLAVELAHDLPRLTRIRTELRKMMRSSPLTDSARFIGNLEAEYMRITSARRR